MGDCVTRRKIEHVIHFQEKKKSNVFFFTVLALTVCQISGLLLRRIGMMSRPGCYLLHSSTRPANTKEKRIMQQK